MVGGVVWEDFLEEVSFLEMNRICLIVVVRDGKSCFGLGELRGVNIF